MRVGRRISVTALNTNINADLILGAGYNLFVSDVMMYGSGSIYGGTVAGGINIYGGEESATSDGSIQLFGSDNALLPGSLTFNVANAAKNARIRVMQLLGVTDTPFLNMLSHRIAGLLQATTDMDAAPVTKVWTTWSPTLTWGGATPASITTVARYCQIARVVYFSLTIDSADSNACSALTISLPVAPIASMPRVALASYERYGAAGATFIDPLAFINQATGLISFAAFQTATDAQAIGISISGAYEV